MDCSPKIQAAFYAFIAESLSRASDSSLMGCAAGVRGGYFAPARIHSTTARASDSDSRDCAGMAPPARSAAAVPELVQKPHPGVLRGFAGSIGPVALRHIAKRRADLSPSSHRDTPCSQGAIREGLKRSFRTRHAEARISVQYSWTRIAIIPCLPVASGSVVSAQDGHLLKASR
jgi:hypothetical protein